MQGDTQVAHGTPVRWKSGLGYTHDGTVTAGPDNTGRYTIVTASGSTALLAREDFELVGVPGGEPDPALTPEQRAALITERGEHLAQRAVTDAIMQVYTLLREDTRDLGQQVEGDAADDMRIEAAVRVHDAATDLRIKLTRQIAEKRRMPPPGTVPAPAATQPAVPDA